MSYTDPVTGLDVLVKQPWEDRLYDIPFDQELRAGDTISTVTSVTQANQGKVAASGDLSIGTGATDGSAVQVRISAGTVGEHYKITARAVTTLGDRIEVDVMMYLGD